MMARKSHFMLLLCIATVPFLLAGCQAVQQNGNPGSTAWLEDRKAEAVKHELGTFDLYMNKDWATLDRETGPDYYGVGVDGSYSERADMMTGIADEKLEVLPPDLGDIRVLMITPDAYMVTYPLNFNGIYDGNKFSNPRTVSSLWVKRGDQWQNIFLSEEERKGELKPSTD
jgi:hypothetical protein